MTQTKVGSNLHFLTTTNLSLLYVNEIVLLDAKQAWSLYLLHSFVYKRADFPLDVISLNTKFGNGCIHTVTFLSIGLLEWYNFKGYGVSLICHKAPDASGHCWCCSDMCVCALYLSM